MKQHKVQGAPLVREEIQQIQTCSVQGAPRHTWSTLFVHLQGTHVQYAEGAQSHGRTFTGALSSAIALAEAGRGCGLSPTAPPAKQRVTLTYFLLKLCPLFDIDIYGARLDAPVTCAPPAQYVRTNFGFRLAALSASSTSGSANLVPWPNECLQSDNGQLGQKKIRSSDMQHVRSDCLSALLYGTLHTPLAYTACSQTLFMFIVNNCHTSLKRGSLCTAGDMRGDPLSASTLCNNLPASQCLQHTLQLQLHTIQTEGATRQGALEKLGANK